jgi:hypothetical protein
MGKRINQMLYLFTLKAVNYLMSSAGLFSRNSMFTARGFNNILKTMGFGSTDGLGRNINHLYIQDILRDVENVKNKYRMRKRTPSKRRRKSPSRKRKVRRRKSRIY